MVQQKGKAYVSSGLWEGRCGSKGCVEKEEEKQNEVGITGTFLIFLYFNAKYKVSYSAVSENIDPCEDKVQEQAPTLLFLFSKHHSSSHGDGLNLQNEVTTMERSKELKKTSIYKSSPTHFSLFLLSPAHHLQGTNLPVSLILRITHCD